MIDDKALSINTNAKWFVLDLTVKFWISYCEYAYKIGNSIHENLKLKYHNELNCKLTEPVRKDWNSGPEVEN